MRLLLALVTAALLAGCASHEYSQVPEPTGEWVPANPLSLMLPPPAAPLPVVTGSRRSGPNYWADRGVQQ